MRRLLMVFLATVVAAVLVTPAVAGKPEQTRVEPGTVLAVYPAGLACTEAVAPEGVQWTFVGGPTTDRLFPDGRFMESGRGEIEVTNIASGRSVVLRLQGSIRQTLTESGSIFDTGGAVVLALFPGDVGPGDTSLGRMYVLRGNAVAEVDHDFVVTAFRSSGQIEDVCAMIA